MEETTVEPGDDLLCIACGYELRELPHDGDCPECGLAISRSEDSDQLARADPHWLSVVARGMGFYIAGQLGIVILFLSFFGSIIFTLVFPAVTPATGPQSWMDVIFTGLAALAVIGLLLMGVGTYLLASPDPGRKEERKGKLIRLLARIAIPGLIFYAAIMSLLDYLPPTALRSTVMNFSINLLYVWGAFAVVMVMLHVARLMGRIPMVPLQTYMTKAVGFLIWAIPVFGVTSWIQKIWIPTGVGSNLGVTSLHLGLSCTSLLLGIFLIGTFIQQGLMMFQCRQAICSCRDIAIQLNISLATDDKISNDDV